MNTIIVEEGEDNGDRILVGDNTDWKGIYNPPSRKLGKSTNQGEKTEVALILGGGGTARAAAYAATQLGLERIYYNRTPSKDLLADMFGGTVVNTLDEIDGDGESSLSEVLHSINGQVQVVISTLPAAAEFELPSWLVGLVANDTGKKPIVFDV